MSYYHYTSLEALNGILQRNEVGEKKLCFWATRYDCFKGKEEYLFGIDCLRECLLNLEKQGNLQEDRKIAAFFKHELIVENINLPFPYVISITSRNDNAYMWENYANHNNGVVLELALPQVNTEFKDYALYRLEKCIYVDSAKEQKIQDFINLYYTNTGLRLLKDGGKDAFDLLSKRPQAFVVFMAMFMLAFAAPAIKRKKFCKEEETRIILSVPVPRYADFIYNNIPLIQDLCHAFHSNLDAKNIANTIMQEKSRLRDDNTVCYYREFPLPEKSLSQVLVLNNESKLKAENILKQKGFDNVKVKIQKLPQKDKSILLQK